MVESMARGDHVYALRMGGLYSHHAIDCGDGSVIHYAGLSDLASGVTRAPWDTFAKGAEVRVRDYTRVFEMLRRKDDAAARTGRALRRAFDELRGVAVDTLDFGARAVIERAESRLGERRFDLVWNNCEHFAAWCKTGLSESRQVEALWRAALAPWEFGWRRTQDALTHLLDPLDLRLRP
jgi:hypothetical protein